MSLLWPIVRKALLHPARVAITDDQRTYSYGKLVGGSLYVAEKLDATTDNPHVGILLPTSGAFAVALLGAWMARRTVVPLNFLLNPAELDHVIRDSRIDTLITAGPMLDYLGRDRLPEHVKPILMDELDFTGFPPLRWPPSIPDEQLAVLLYTSGTSGKPKGVMLTHGNLHANVRDACEHCRFDPNIKLFGVLPQFHSFGFTGLTLVPLYLGAQVVYSARFIPNKIARLIKKHKPDVMLAVPSMYSALLSVKDAEPDDFASLHYGISGGEPLPESTRQRCAERFNLQLLEGYGLTETAPVTNWATPWDNRPGSVGKALPNVHEIVVDEHDKPLPPGQDGEILIAGPNIMKGYYRLPEETKRVFTDLTLPGPDGPVTRTYFRTGDIGRFDEEGFLSITGRKKEMLIIAGENVFPREIEEVLNKHPSVKDSAVIGKPDDMRGEEPVAFVELNEGHELNTKALQAHLRESLAVFKIPRDIRAVEELPRSPTGKIMRRHLKA